MSGWFADVDTDVPTSAGEYVWQPCFSPVTPGVVHAFDVWFRSREECEAYIRDELLPVANQADFEPPGGAR